MLAGIIVGAVLLAVITLILLMWRKAPTDKAFVITGLRQRVIKGKGTIVIPIIEQVDKISLESIELSVRTDSSLDSNGVPLNADGIAVIKVIPDDENIIKAMTQFNTGNLKGTIDVIRNTATNVLEGKLREIISKLSTEEIYRDREMFANEVENVAKKDLEKMGLEIVTFTIKDIDDENGYLKALGASRIAQVKKDAAIAEANAQREQLEKTAEADRLGREAQILADTQIAQAEKDKELKIQAYKEEQERAKAKADLAYKVEENKVKQQVIETEQAALLLEEQKKTQVAEQQAIKKEKELEATVKKQADAEKYRLEKQSEAHKYQEEKEADAKRYALEQQAEARKVEVELNAQAKASEIAQLGRAEAEAIRLKGEATAEAMKAEAEAMKEKAEAYKQYGEAAIIEMLVDKLPLIAESIAKPLAQTDKMVIIDNGGEGGASRVTKNVTNVVAQVPEVVESLTGVNLIDIVGNLTKSKETQEGDKKEIKVDKDLLDTAKALGINVTN